MGGEQSLDRMSGFRKAMPFTFLCFIVGGLALSGLPPFSGWLSKDDIIGYLNNRGGGFEILGILGYVGALMTGIYTFRMIFRAFWGEPCEEARELEHGHLVHHEVPTNPQTGEAEDTDVGFPGPEHHIAERDWPMRFAMGGLMVLAVIGGALQIPGVDDAAHQVPGADVRHLAPLRPGGRHRHRVGRPDHRRAHRRRRHRDRLPHLGAQARHVGGAGGAAAPAAHLPLQQVVLRRAHRHAHRAPDAVAGPLQ